MEEYFVKSIDGTRLFVRNWLPDEKVEKIITFVHGIGEHTGRYENVAGFFAKDGYIFNAFDLRGHGKSEGKRGFAASYDLLMQDIAYILDEIEKKYPNLPHILYGHSMGGNLVLNYVLKHDPKIAGVISTSPWLRLVNEPDKLAFLLARFLNKVYPSMHINNGLRSSDLSHTSKISEGYIRDNYVHNKITPRLYFSIRESGEWALQNANGIKIPCLLMHGSSDRITSPQASAEFTSGVQSGCTSKLWDGLYHELHNESNSTDILNYMLQWVNEQIKVK